MPDPSGDPRRLSQGATRAGRPTVSVILPTYNRGRYLHDAVTSVLRQTSPAWELIVVDDGSTDRSTAFLEQHHDERVVLLRASHCANPSRLRNIGLGQSTGQYIAFLDSDDLWEPEKLEVQIRALQDTPAAGWSYSDLTRIDARGNPLRAPTTKRWTAYSGWILPQLLTLDAIVHPATVIARKSLIDEVGRFDESQLFCEDYDLWFRLAAASRVVAVDRALARVRSHDAHYSADRIAVYQDWVRVYQKVRRRHDDQVLGRLCARECAHNSIKLAVLWFDHRRPARALLSIMRALRYDPRVLRWFGLLARPAVRWVVPRSLLRRWRGRRRKATDPRG